MANIDFAALLCSRLCHDLVSPVGAINNGLEILQDEKDASMRDAVLDLIDKSTRQTSNKLLFFRLAFGAAGGFSSQLDLRECEKALRAFLEGTKVQLDWKVPQGSGSKNFIKVLLNLGLVVSETMIRGGTLKMEMTADSEKSRLLVSGEGQRIILQPVVRSAIEGKLSEAEVDPRAAPAYLAQVIARDSGGSLVLEVMEESRISIVAEIDFAAESSAE
ncbi:MAG: histidine phosphotransferase [Alphaproteobacteria bacterium]|nr:histidine phosphotransferase [Alphaproteobacteria bacterium]